MMAMVHTWRRGKVKGGKQEAQCKLGASLSYIMRLSQKKLFLAESKCDTTARIRVATMVRLARDLESSGMSLWDVCVRVSRWTKPECGRQPSLGL